MKKMKLSLKEKTIRACCEAAGVNRENKNDCIVQLIEHAFDEACGPIDAYNQLSNDIETLTKALKAIQ